MNGNSTGAPGFIKILIAVIILTVHGCIEPDDNIVYGPDNPDPYPTHDEVAVIDSIVPGISYPTDTVIVRGSGFDTSSADKNFVIFGTANAEATAVWSDSLEVVVPLPSPIDYSFSDTVLVKVALQGSYDWSNEVSFVFKPMAHVYLANEYPPAPHTEENFTQPRGLEFDTEGNAYLMNARLRSIYQDSPAGIRTVYAFGGRFNGGLRMGPDGYLYAAGNSNSIIYRIPPGGGSFEEWATVPNPWGMDFDRFGKLFVVDKANGHLYWVSTDGTAEKVAELPGIVEKAYCRVYGDAVYVNEYATGMFFKIPLTENAVGEVDTAMTIVEGYWVNDFTFGADGSMYIAGHIYDALLLITKSALIKVDLSGDQVEVVELDGEPGFVTWYDKFLYTGLLTGGLVYKVLIHDNEGAPYNGRGE